MNVVDYVASKFEDDGSGELSQMMTPIEGLLWELLTEAKRLRAEVERLTDKVNSATVYANCRINGHSASCNRETWRAMVAKLGERVKELPDSETYEHPEPTLSLREEGAAAL